VLKVLKSNKMKFSVVLHTDDGTRYGVTVPKMILTRIDDYAKKRGQSRSGFLVEAAREAVVA
jgi:metal-responsive CopG/Arc/MetJ family transcriptional regulator